MRLADLGPLPLSIIASLVVAVLLLAVRIFVLQRIQQRRQRENRQETERLKSLVAAYRSLAGSFTPATGAHRPQMEEALADVVLFGSIHQVELAAQCAISLVRGDPVAYQPLIEALRSDLRSNWAWSRSLQRLNFRPRGQAVPRARAGAKAAAQAEAVRAAVGAVAGSAPPAPAGWALA